MADTSAGFRYRGTLSGGLGAAPWIQDVLAADTATYYKGDLVNLETGELDPVATNDSAILGAVLETVSCTDSTTYVKVICNPDAVYGVYDANARLIGAQLDISTTAGAMTVTTDSNHDLVVVANSSATEETLVMIAHGKHAFN